MSGTNDKAGSDNLLTRFVSLRAIKENFLEVSDYNTTKFLQMDQFSPFYQQKIIKDCKQICVQKLVDHISSLSWEDENNDYSDVILKAGGKEYHLHKVIICRSSYFKGLLNWPTEDPNNSNDSLDESKKQVVKLCLKDAGITSSVLEAILKRLYADPDLYYEKKDPVKFIAAGDYFDIPDMVQMGLESSGSIHYASSPDFVKAAMNNEYGEYSR
ncbi:unnamed protein product [Ambrosiozyma monospora]|uniref:Unnamed protein product n=1 Tax=Ambrosiozyma monospora TaxID=43982 RepID=A0A9W6WHQ3_AMBMO|nr:unnamed protein product [Ambrosiozyma monospora]